ncbi:MAG: acyl-CoA synthetase [Pseudomonadales bacterium]|jgi:malonyl-CoA/methylmalonyl-CoA synthetase|nr:acyl-CoA synthetase [Pseudomonadales bacterium]MCP5336829.1 AMP-binding protein [Pseudomonadales bacterium]
MTELFERVGRHADRVAFRDGTASVSYAQLLQRSERMASALLGDKCDLAGERIAMLVPAGAAHVVAQWAIWRAGGCAVPLNPVATAPEIDHVLRTAGVLRALVVGKPAEALVTACAATRVQWIGLDALESTAARTALPELESQRPAMIVFTSGTTGKPKGALFTHATVAAQVRMLVEAWEWQETDRIPLFLPLHHVHGIVNVMCCALWSGACIEAFERFDTARVLERVAVGAYSVFMAVPTVYVKLIEALEAQSAPQRERCTRGFAAMRLMISGSAALPATVHAHWQRLSGHALLERYGMTEIGMALANPLHGERRPGSVGLPLPGVEVRLVDEQGASIDAEDEPGEVQVRGPAVFAGYWNDPEATRRAFSDDGWFMTGDVAVRERGYFRILGRRSVDIIKSGGYKLSALEIENVLLEHPAVRECAVVGVADELWGEAVAAAVVPEPGATLALDGLLAWCRDRLSAYKHPRRLLLLEALPRNALGKPLKPVVRALFEQGNTGPG